jgi:rhamnogalacturonan endolyase
MSPPARTRRPRRAVTTAFVAAASAFALILSGVDMAPANAAGDRLPNGVRLEHLDRGLVAATTSDGVFLSWRLLASEVSGHSSTGLTGVNFNVYRDGRRIATVTDSTNYLDRGAPAGAEYRVKPVVWGTEVGRSAPVRAWASNYLDVPLKKPADGVTPPWSLFPNGMPYSYRANDASVGDVDGDGQYELILKWEPDNAKDVSQWGYTGNTYIDTYKFDGTLLHRIDLGVNIRSGAHYTQFLVNDFDGDGKSEMMFKTAPGTKIIKYAPDGSVVSERYITMPESDVSAGYQHTDDYRLSSTGFYEHLVKMFKGWQTHPEVVGGRWPKTVEQAINIEPRYSYPLSDADARSLVDHFLDVYGATRHGNNTKLRNEFVGFIVDGPEYLTVFDGATGNELQTVHYKPGRHDDGLMWGDYEWNRIEPGNRVDRFLATVAYLDGKHPSAVFARGYYTRTSLVAYDWDGKKLSERWFVDSGWVRMSNPLFREPRSNEGDDPVFGKLAGQGDHSLGVGDVDGDGKQEVVYGSATIDDDGKKLLYSSTGVLPPGSSNPGATVPLGHGDAMHVADIDPDRPGMEIYTAHEGATSAPYGHALRDAKTGEALFGAYSGRDTGRAMVGDVRPDVPGMEVWAAMPPNSGDQPTWGLLSAKGVKLEPTTPGTNMSIRWAADGTTQIVHGALTGTYPANYEKPTIRDWRGGIVLSADDTSTSNHSKGNPALVADIFGDWREELVLRKIDSTGLRIYLSTEVTGRKLYTLMQDPQYRADIARQQTGYNQPAYTGWYLASDTRWDRVPVPRYWSPGAIRALRSALDDYAAGGDVAGPNLDELRGYLDRAVLELLDSDANKSIDSLHRFESRIKNPRSDERVSPEARAALEYQVRSLVTMLA